MKARVTVLLSAHLPWWSQWQTPNYLAHLLVRRANVVYVEPRVAWTRDAPVFSWKQNLALLRSAMREIGENLSVYTPWVLPLGRFRRVASWNERLFITGLRRAMVGLPMTRVILWLAETQNSLSLVQLFPDAPRIFHALDHFVEGRDARAASELARGADLVLAASPLIARSLEGVAPRIHVFRNGWDFPGATRENGPIPEEVARIPAPRVGLVSYLSSNLDYSLLLQLVESLPISLVCVGRLIGHLSTEDRILIDQLRRKPQVFFLGEIPTEKLPSYLLAFDVCIAPYKNTHRIYASDPLKVYQYLALGKPVVATPVEVLEGLQPLVRIGRTHAEFIMSVQRELNAPPDEGLQRRRLEFAESTHWENRWKALERVLARDERLAILADSNSRQASFTGSKGRASKQGGDDPS